MQYILLRIYIKLFIFKSYIVVEIYGTNFGGNCSSKHSTRRTSSGATVVTNNIQLSTAEPKYAVVPVKETRSASLEMEHLSILPETLTQGEIKAIEANRSNI